MVIRKIFKTGHSLAITLSKKVLEELGLKEGDGVDVGVEDGRVIVKKSKSKSQLDLGFKVRPKL